MIGDTWKDAIGNECFHEKVCIIPLDDKLWGVDFEGLDMLRVPWNSLIRRCQSYEFSLNGRRGTTKNRVRDY